MITSAFDSAGQRCSSLRILCLQDEIAEPVLHMLKGAMAELSVGNPLLLSTDIGPVINMNSKKFILNHIQSFREKGCKVFQACSQTMLDDLKGEYIAPTIIELSLLSQL
ncbi:Bifunctional protein PutA [compost metagenome]